MSYNPLPLLGQAEMIGSLPVVIASNQTPVPVTTFGTELSTFHLISAASTNATIVKNSPGAVNGWYIYNNAITQRKVAFHNTAGTPTAGTAILFSLVIPASSGANVAFPSGINFTLGIGITTTINIPDNDTAIVGLNDLTINIFFR